MTGETAAALELLLAFHEGEGVQSAILDGPAGVTLMVRVRPGYEHPERSGTYTVKVKTPGGGYTTSLLGTRFGWNTNQDIADSRVYYTANKFDDDDIEYWIELEELLHGKDA